MAAQIIDGKAQAAELRNKVKNSVAQRLAHGKRAPGLAVILVGADPASQVYVGSKRRACGEAGILSKSYDLPGDTAQTALLALVQVSVMRALAPRYDVKPMAQAIKAVQDAGRPVANAAKYHAQYQFLGRLEKPLAEVHGPQIAAWLAAHPDGYVVIYLEHAADHAGIPARHGQAYRGGSVVLVDAATAASLLAVHVE